MPHVHTFDGIIYMKVIFEGTHMSIDKCIEDAMLKLTPQKFGNQSNTEVLQENCEIYAWPQHWPSADCGTGECSNLAITTSTTVVIIGPEQDACIYHNSQFAYKIEDTDGIFWACLDQREMPGREEFERERKHCL